MRTIKSVYKTFQQGADHKQLKAWKRNAIKKAKRNEFWHQYALKHPKETDHDKYQG